MRVATRWVLLAGMATGTVFYGARKLLDAPGTSLEINTAQCALVTERQRIDARSLRVPPEVDKQTVQTLVNAYSSNRVQDVADTWLLRGTINAAMAEALERRLAQGPAPRLLRVNSYGGDEHAAIRIARVIDEHRLAVSVDGVCGSACANYLLPAAPEVTVDGVVLMHGSPAGCQRQLGTFGAIATLGWHPALGLRASTRRQLDFEARHPHFNSLVELSQPPSRSDPSGATHDWRVVPPRDLTAAHPRLTMGPRHAEVARTYRAWLQTNPMLGGAYFPD